MRRRTSALAVSLLCAVLFASAAEAAEEARDTPRASMLGYLEACRDGEYGVAATYLDLRPIRASEREARGPDLARDLKVVLDRTLWVDVDALSDSPGGRRDDDLPPGRELVGELTTRSGPVPVLLERVGDEWLISGSTVSRIPALYDELGYGALGEYIPAPLLEIRILELELWQWIGLILAVIVAYALATGVALLAARAVAPLLARTETEIDDRLLKTATAPLAATFAIGLFYPAALALGLSVPAQRFVGGLCKGLVVVTVAWLAMRLIDLGTEVVRSRMIARGNAAATSLLPIGRRLAKVFLLVLALLSLLDNLDYDVTGLIAGLGIGGLAVALAAQKTFENFFGSMELVGDRPVAVGDFCRFGDQVGPHARPDPRHGSELAVRLAPARELRRARSDSLLHGSRAPLRDDRRADALRPGRAEAAARGACQGARGPGAGSLRRLRRVLARPRDLRLHRDR
jgi:MscS family membrane protein